MENTNLSEEAIVVKQLDADIEDLELNIFTYENHLMLMRAKLIRLTERKKNIENYLNNDNENNI